MKVDRILETAIYAEDLEAAEAFYTRVLGMEIHKSIPGRHLFFKVGEGMFLVFNPNVTEKESDPHGCRGIGHVAWAVPTESMDEWRKWFKKQGVAYTDHIWPSGNPSIYFKDPAGNSLELTTPKTWGLS